MSDTIPDIPGEKAVKAIVSRHFFQLVSEIFQLYPFASPMIWCLGTAGILAIYIRYNKQIDRQMFMEQTKKLGQNIKDALGDLDIKVKDLFSQIKEEREKYAQVLREEKEKNVAALNEEKQRNVTALKEEKEKNAAMLNYGLGQLKEEKEKSITALKEEKEKNAAMLNYGLGQLKEEREKNAVMFKDALRQLKQRDKDSYMWKNEMAYIKKQNEILQEQSHALYNMAKNVYESKVGYERFENLVGTKEIEKMVESYKMMLDDSSNKLGSQFNDNEKEKFEQVMKVMKNDSLSAFSEVIRSIRKGIARGGLKRFGRL